MMPLTQTQGYRAVQHQAQAVLTPQAFRDWLVEHYYQSVGCASSECSCPLAGFLSAACRVPFEVQEDVYWPMGAQFSVPQPSWARAFVHLLDAVYDFAPVTGEQALAVLDYVLQGHNSPFKR
jgi:hypothetical protein